MQDLNDLRYFDAVVTNGGFAPAGRALRLPKSKLSRRIAALEERLGARLIERSSRRFRVTDIGLAFHAQAQLAVAAAERAEALVEASLSEPRGTVRMACPTGLVPVVATMLPDFLILYPKGHVQIVAADRPVDIIAERIDVALRVRTRLDSDAALTMRTFGTVVSLLDANDVCGFSSLGVAAAPTFVGEVGDDGSTAVFAVVDCTITLPADTPLGADCGGVATTGRPDAMACATFTLMPVPMRIGATNTDARLSSAARSGSQPWVRCASGMSSPIGSGSDRRRVRLPQHCRPGRRRHGSRVGVAPRSGVRHRVGWATGAGYGSRCPTDTGIQVISRR